MTAPSPDDRSSGPHREAECDVAASLDGILPISDYTDRLAVMRQRAGLDG